jgi:hypothetical protein
MSTAQATLWGGIAHLPKAREDGNRIVGDAYYTPDPLARAIVAELQERHFYPSRILEPNVGGGAFARALLRSPHGRPRLTLLDINPTASGLRLENIAPDHGYLPPTMIPGVDFLSYQPEEPFHLIIGNPPYAQAEAHVRHALSMSYNVVMLLRSAFGESAARIDFWTEHPARHVWMLAQRPSFTSDGKTDGCAYSVFWWDNHHEGPTTFTPCWDWKGGAL